MSISPGDLLDIVATGDPVAVAQTNFEHLTREIYEFEPSQLSGVATTIIGPPTTGDYTENRRWKDAWGGEWKCTVAGNPGTWRQERPAIRAGEPNSGTIPTGYLIRDSNADYKLKKHVGSYTWVTIGSNLFTDLELLTGGTATALDAVVTTGLADGELALFNYSGKTYLYKLRAGTDAESSPWIIRPDDYATTTNEKVWVMIETFDYPPKHLFREISGLTGGGATDLTTIPTAELDTGLVVFFIFNNYLNGYRLRAGVDATSSPEVLRPADFQSVLNPKIWERIMYVAAPGDIMIGNNNLSEISTSVAKRLAARANIDSLWSDDARGLVAGRNPMGGLYCTATSSFQITGTAGVNLGTGSFTISAVYTFRSVTSCILFASHSTGNNRIALFATSASVFTLRFYDSGGVTADYTLTLDSAMVSGQTYSVVLTCDRTTATLYVNGISDRDKTGSGVTATVSASSSVDIGSGNANVWAAFGPGGVVPFITLHNFSVFNRTLSAANALELCGRGSTPYSNQWGSLTASYTSDFSAGADSWSGDSSATVTGNTDGIGGQDNTLLIEAAVVTARATRAVTNREIGKYVKLTYSVYIPSTNVTGVQVRPKNASNSAFGFDAQTPAADTWVTYTATAELTAELGSALKFELRTSGASPTVTLGDKFYIKDVRIDFVGAVLDLDLHNAAPSISTAVKDRSSNNNHGAATAANILQTQIHRQVNAQTLCVGAASVLSKLLSATAALNFGSIAADAEAELTITVTGAATGDSVAPGWPSTLEAGLVGIMFVSASNTVTVRLRNTTGGAIDPASQTFRATVFQFA